MTRATSLFHFTEKFDTLKTILKCGFFWPRYFIEEKSWLAPDIIFPMVCFCDTGLSHLEEHTDFYGNYGLGMTQEWGEKLGLNPVIYLNDTSPLARKLKQSAKTEAPHLLAYIKPMVGPTTKTGSLEDKDFYEECEWRFVPEAVFTTKECGLPVSALTRQAALDRANEAMLEHPLIFGASDIRYLFVKDTSEIPDLYDFIQTLVDGYSAPELKILTSRILSLQELGQDPVLARVYR